MFKTSCISAWQSDFYFIYKLNVFALPSFMTTIGTLFLQKKCNYDTKLHVCISVRSCLTTICLVFMNANMMYIFIFASQSCFDLF